MSSLTPLNSFLVFASQRLTHLETPRLRFQVKDNRPSEKEDVEIGFFEVCLGDPWQENLVGDPY